MMMPTYDGTGGKDKWDQSTAPVGSFKLNGDGFYPAYRNIHPGFRCVADLS